MQNNVSTAALRPFLTDDIPDLPVSDWRLLGKGLWGEVHDLGDGSILKLVRRAGGLGSGESKVIREGAALGLLGGLANDYVRVPRLIGSALFRNGYIGSAMGMPPLAGWVRIERLAGEAIDGHAVAMVPSRRETLGERLGAAIAALHEAAAPHLDEMARLGDPILRSLKEAVVHLGGPSDRSRLDRLETEWRGSVSAPVVLHGDINLGNILYTERAGPIGFVDFAEAGAGAPEADLRHFEGFGPLRDAILRGYGAFLGEKPDMARYRMATAVDAAVTLAIEGSAGHPREAMRRRYWLDECLRQAGIE
ncbi:MAG: phosphotransferase [Parvibaculaceae bacterium]|nr:phosphotransferase [Parvibaculaceae bacterium]